MSLLKRIVPATPPDDRAHVMPAVNDGGSTSPPMGIVMSVAVVAMVTGAASAKLFYDTAPFLAWVTVIGLCGGLLGLAKLFARRTPTRFSLHWTPRTLLPDVWLPSGPRRRIDAASGQPCRVGVRHVTRRVARSCGYCSSGAGRGRGLSELARCGVSSGRVECHPTDDHVLARRHDVPARPCIFCGHNVGKPAAVAACRDGGRPSRQSALAHSVLDVHVPATALTVGGGTSDSGDCDRSCTRHARAGSGHTAPRGRRALGVAYSALNATGASTHCKGPPSSPRIGSGYSELVLAPLDAVR